MFCTFLPVAPIRSSAHSTNPTKRQYALHAVASQHGGTPWQAKTDAACYDGHGCAQEPNVGGCHTALGGSDLEGPAQKLDGRPTSAATPRWVRKRFSVALPPAFISAICFSLHLSILTDRTNEYRTPRARCFPVWQRGGIGVGTQWAVALTVRRRGAQSLRRTGTPTPTLLSSQPCTRCEPPPTSQRARVQDGGHRAVVVCGQAMAAPTTGQAGESGSRCLRG